jgi:hypothetical protein
MFASGAIETIHAKTFFRKVAASYGRRAVCNKEVGAFLQIRSVI